MFLIHRLRYSGCCRMLKKFWLKIFVFFAVFIVSTILFLSWKFDKELTRLSRIRQAQMGNIQRMADLSTEKSKMYDTWRVPDLDYARIFSAYLDLRPEIILEEVPNASSQDLWALIRIIGIIPLVNRYTPLTCYYKFSPDALYNNETVMMEAPAIATRMVASIENFGMQYTAAFILCKLIRTDEGRFPTEVTFSSTSGRTSRDLKKIDFVEVRYTISTSSLTQKQFMAVCTPSMHHGYDKYANLIEFVEFYRMMGVEHFTFYNDSVTNNVSRVLAYYENLDIATVIQWKLPKHYLFEKTLRYNGIFALLNECLYRNTMVGGYRYVVNVDLDEFIMPRKYENYHELMNYLDPASESKKYGAFIFRNMFFYLMHEDSPVPQEPPDIPKLLLHAKTKRWERINPAYDRSKYIVKGQEVIEMGNHQLWHMRKTSLVFRTSYKEMIVDPSIGGSHHYRQCEVTDLACWLRQTVVDETAHKFTKELGRRVSNVLKNVFGADRR